MVEKNYTESPLAQIRIGIDVFDLYERQIGTVENVRVGEEELSLADAEWLRPSHFLNALAEDVREAVHTETAIRPSLRAWLNRYGYLRIDVGPDQPNRLVMPQLIHFVDQDGVHLNVLKEDLIEA